MLWALVRLVESDNPRWWLAAGSCSPAWHCWSKFTVVMLVPAVLAFALVPDWTAALAAQPLSVAGGADRGHGVPAGIDLERAARLGVVPLSVGARGGGS